MSTLDFTNAKTGNGPAIVAWLERNEDLTWLSETSRKRIQRWRRGAQASFWSVDRVMGELRLHVSDLPHDVWIPYSNGRGREAG